MPTLFVFLLKVNIALLLFCAGYYLVLRHLTFYTLNRIYLVGAILFATVYPRINLDGFAQRHRQLTQPVQVVVSRLQAPAETLVKPLTQPIYWYWAEVLFFAGAAFLAMRLLMQLFSLYKVYRASKSANILGHSVRVIDGDGGPFSFWKNIYINPASYEVDELRSILQHEQVHTDELHTLDVLLAELSVIFYWFNPGVWLMRNAVRENIEFITDRKILQKGIDSKKYQYSLLNVTFASTQPGIANHFNISTLKKRIIMMNAKRTSKTNLTRYVLLLPIVLVCLLSFSFSKAELIKKSKSTYKTIEVTVKDIALTNPIASFFKKRDNAILTARSIDTIKIIRSGHKDTIKIVQGNGTVYNLANGYRVGNLEIDTNGKPHITGYKNFTVLNLKTDTSGGRVQLRRSGPGGGAFLKADTIRINGKTYYSANYRFGKDSLLSGLAGKVAGLQIKSTGAGVSASTSVQLRGSRAVNGSNAALIIIDGMPLPSGDISSIDPKTIESYDILNGEAASKAYGVKGANGVIVITTKKGAGDRSPRIYNTYTVTTGNKNADSLLKRMHGLTVAKDGKVTHDTVTFKEVTVVGYNIRKGMPGTQKDSETSINDLSGKLVIVDGVEATDKDLKVSAINIKSIAIKSGDEMIKKYGDKAKNGVVFITTTKPK